MKTEGQPDSLAAVRSLRELRDGRLWLRHWRPSDAAMVIAACRDGDIPGWCVGIPEPYGKAEARAFFKQAARGFKSGQRALLAIADAKNGEALGAIGLELRAARQAGEIGYWMSHAQRRRGLTVAALRLLSAWALNEAGLARLELLVHVDNTASQAVAGRAGFRCEGVLRGYLLHRGRRGDYYLYSRLPSDPLPDA